MACVFCHDDHAVNDKPSFTAGGAVIVAEDSAPYSAAWATNISSGQGESDPLAFKVNCSTASAGLFAVAPAVNSAGQLSFSPAASMFGNASCTVTLTEQMAGGLSDSKPLSIEVTPGEGIAFDPASVVVLLGVVYVLPVYSVVSAQAQYQLTVHVV
jgi:hypothetical protein